jgi:hypothetical protein
LRREEDRVAEVAADLSNGSAANEPELPGVEELQQLAASAQIPDVDDLKPLEKTNRHWQQTYHLKDSWFLLRNGGGLSARCRLAALIKDLDQFMFVNRVGSKVAVYSRLQLAHALKDKVLVPLDRGPIFERALQQVVGKLGDTSIETNF